MRILHCFAGKEKWSSGIEPEKTAEKEAGEWLKNAPSQVRSCFGAFFSAASISAVFYQQCLNRIC